jgi:hypothetical protein
MTEPAPRGRSASRGRLGALGNEAVNMAKSDQNYDAYIDQATFKSDFKTDQKIYDAALSKKDAVNSGKEKYNFLTNNCTNGVEGNIKAATGAFLPSSSYPNTNFKELKNEQSTIKKNLTQVLQ